MKPQPQRSWSEVSNEELQEILYGNPNRRVRKAAKSELRKREGEKLVEFHTQNHGDQGKVEITAIRLSAFNFLRLFFNALPALILATVVVWIIVFLLNMLMLHVFTKSISDDLKSRRATPIELPKFPK